MLGYLDMPEETKMFFGSSTLAILDIMMRSELWQPSQGTDRTKNFHLYQNKLEEILMANHAVEEAAVFDLRAGAGDCLGGEEKAQGGGGGGGGAWGPGQQAGGRPQAASRGNPLCAEDSQEPTWRDLEKPTFGASEFCDWSLESISLPLGAIVLIGMKYEL